MTIAGAMTAEQVHVVLDALINAGCRAWVGGGWGVDALIGRQTRSHRDLDLAIDVAHEGAAVSALATLGYRIETDWRPVRVELIGRQSGWVDLHPVAFDDNGDGRQADLDGGFFAYPRGCFTTGHIAGRPVGCLSAEQQLRFHSGYELRAIDVADLELLHGLVRSARVARSRPAT